MSKFVRIIALAFGLCAGPAVAIAAESERETLRVGYSNFAPYSTTLPDGQGGGYGIDILRQIAAEMGLDVSFVRTNNPGETLSLLRQGRIDVTGLLGQTAQRDKIADFSVPVDRLDISVLALETSGIAAREDLDGRPVGVVAGSSATALVERHMPGAELTVIHSFPESLMALLTGTVDALVLPEGPLRALARKAGVSERIALVETLTSQEMTFLVRDADQALLADIDAHIEALRSAGELTRLHNAWFGRERHILERPEVRLMLSAGALAALALSVGGGIAWNANRRANRSTAEFNANRMLLEALNGVDLIVITWDRDLRPLHWNAATEARFPELIEMLHSGRTFGEFVRESYVRGSVAPMGDQTDIEAIASRIERQLIENGHTQPRVFRCIDGPVYEAIDFRIGKDTYASIRKDVTRQEARAERERQAYTARLLALFDNAAVGLAQVAADGCIMEANAKLAGILDVQPGQLCARRFADYVLEEDRPALLQHMAQVLRERSEEGHIEVRMRTASGTVLWANITLSKVVETADHPGYLVICAEDVTERRETEDQRLTLLGELSHRVKNILAVVQMITMQTLRNAGTGSDVREKVFIRLRALSTAHDLVFRGDGQDLETVLRVQIAPFGEERERLTTRGPHVALPVDLVYSLGLIVHELTTNAVKYGALSVAEGGIHVDWSVEDQVLDVTWCERGGPPVSAPTRHGFGSRLIGQMVGHARGGSVSFDFQPDGLTVKLTVNLEDEA